MPREPVYDATTTIAADAIQTLVTDFFRKHEGARAHEPVAGSAAADDANEAAGLPGAAALSGNLIREMWQVAACALFAAEDHALALAALLRADDTILGLFVAARSVIEASGRVHWLLASGLSVQDRISRSLGYQYEGQRHLALLVQPLVDADPDHPDSRQVTALVDHQREHLLATAAALGLKTETKRAGAWAGQRPPGSGKVAVAVLTAAGQSHGAAFYNYLSGVAHGDVRRIQMYLRAADHPANTEAGPSSSWAQPTLDVAEALNVTRRALHALIVAERMYWDYLGWDEAWAIDEMANHTMSKLQRPPGATR